MKAIRFVISGLSHRTYIERLENAKTAWRTMATLAVEPGLTRWFELRGGGIHASPRWWQVEHLANGATSAFRLEGM